MTGAVIATIGGGSASAGGVTTPGATSWATIYGDDVAYDSPVTITTITTPISITASMGGGGGTLLFTLNGSAHTYTGAFTVSVGDTLAWGIAAGHALVSGTITVTNATTSTTLQTIAYVVNSTFGRGGYQ